LPLKKIIAQQFHILMVRRVVLAGTSRGVVNGRKVVSDDEVSLQIKRAVEWLESSFEKEDLVEVWSGSGTVPIAMYKSIKNHPVLQYVLCCSQAATKGYWKGHTPAKQHIYGKRHGDESQILVSSCPDGFIRIGGGPQTYKEMALFRSMHPNAPVLELDLAYYDTHFPNKLLEKSGAVHTGIKP
jgi:hypothetical protein